MTFKSLSIHPKFAAFLDLVVGLLFLWSLNRMAILWVLIVYLVIRLLWWVVLVRLVFYPPNVKRFWHLLTLAFFHLGVTLLLLFIEWTTAWYLVGAIYLIFPFISFWLLPVKNESLLSFVIKPYRRWRFWMSVFGLYGIWGAVYAAISLQILNISYWIILLTAVIVTGAMSCWWWTEYQIEKKHRLWWWVVCTTIFVGEISWVLFVWPLGYFVSALILVWLWYDIWLLARFHLLASGINWRKQILFFIINGVLLLTYLALIVKWK